MKKKLKDNEVMQKIFKDFNVDIDELDLFPMNFGDLDVSAKTDHAVVIFNYKLLMNGDFEENYGYMIHEVTHVLQQTTGNGPTKGADDGEYLNNPFEQEGFQNQVEFMANEFGEEEAKDYVDDLLDHHEITNKKEKREKKEILLSKI